nr:megakaryocyte-associated tyrosine-protein kinase-like [Lytechinus pictus]
MIRWIPEDSLSKDLILLGEGTFTQVWKADLRKKVGNKTRITTVAIKCPKMDAPQIVQQKFSQSVDQMASWEHSHIIRFEGIGGGYKLVMQYASEGSLDRYMRRMGEGRRLGVTSQLTAAYQLMDGFVRQGCEILYGFFVIQETKRYAHGNVSAHNVLVSRSAPDIIIKLADPMLGAYYHSLDMKNHAKLQRARWTAPELLATNSEPTYAGDKFSYAITLWQIMSHGAIPEDKLSDDQVKYNYLNGVRLDPPEDCPNVLMRIMESCWSHIPSNRPPCRGVLRDIHNLLELSRDKPEFRDHGEVAMIPTESDDEDDDHTDLDNVDNERRDTISPPNSSSDGGSGAGSGIGRPTGATRVADILDEIAEHLNAQGDEDILDPVSIYIILYNSQECSVI